MNHDVLVIGSGQAGVPLATRLAGTGRRVVLVEAADLGGTCVNSGCTPTKTMIASARAAHVARSASRLGVHTGPVTVDLGAIVDRKDAVVRQWREGVGRRLSGASVEVIHGRARFLGAREIEVNGVRHGAETIVINVGCRPVVPRLPGLDTTPFLDNRSVMNLRTIPPHLVVLGGGYIGCEFAQMFRRFGSEVTVVDQADRLLAQEDPDVSAALAAVFEQEGIRLELGRSAESIEPAPEGLALRLANAPAIAGSHLLVAVGRAPNTHDLGADAAGLALDARGYIPVDDRYRTNVEGVYAVGDVTPGPQFTHASWDDHRLLFDHLIGRSGRGRNDRLIPITAFTDPPLARVGLTETEARKRGIAHEVATMPFGHIARAIEVDETAGLLKVLIDPVTERVLGATILGAEAGELIHVFVVLMQAGAPARALVDAECVHPTFAEGLQSLVMRLPRYAL